MPGNRGNLPLASGVLGSHLLSWSHASRRLIQYGLAIGGLRAVSGVVYGQHTLDKERGKTQPFPQSSQRGCLRTCTGNGQLPGSWNFLGHPVHGLQLGCPSYWLKSPFPGSICWKKTLLHPGISLNIRDPRNRS